MYYAQFLNHMMIRSEMLDAAVRRAFREVYEQELSDE